MGFWGYLLLIIFGIVVAAYFYISSELTPNNINGKIGESLVQNILGKTIPSEQYVINKLMLNLGEKKSCQIDHVLINSSGVFVIETKNWAGRIYGKENDQNWTQVLKRTKKRKLHNPIKQNKTHIYHISNILSEKLPIFSVVVLVQGNTKKINAPGVYTLEELKELISKKDNTITSEQMKKAYDELWQANDFTILNEEHTRNVKNMVKNIDTTCPRCGKKLVERNGKNGAFMGCSGYPKCRFTKSI